jgi:hypothetical protein
VRNTSSRRPETGNHNIDARLPVGNNLLEKEMGIYRASVFGVIGHYFCYPPLLRVTRAPLLYSNDVHQPPTDAGCTARIHLPPSRATVLSKIRRWQHHSETADNYFQYCMKLILFFCRLKASMMQIALICIIMKLLKSSFVVLLGRLIKLLL